MDNKNEIRGEKLRFRKKNWKAITTFKIISFLIGLLLIWESISISIRPTLIALCKVKSQVLATSISGKVVQNVMSGLGYLDLITLDRDSSGNILALRANVIEMNKLSSNINNLIQKEYSNLEDMYIKVPIGNFIGNELLARERTKNYGKDYSFRNSKY